MIFNDTTSNKQGIVQDIYFGVGANASSYPIAELTRDANTSLDVATFLILGADGRWQFDSNNSTDLTIGTTDLNSDQQDYSFDEDYLVIRDLIITDSNGNKTRLIPIDNADMGREEALSSFMNVTGVPIYYDKIGNSIMLYPKPNYSYTKAVHGVGGIEAYFQRKIDYFTVTDTDKQPGYANHLHKFTSLYCQTEYARAKNLKKLPQLEKALLIYTGNEHLGGHDKGAIKRHYATRDRHQKGRITNNNIIKR